MLTVLVIVLFAAGCKSKKAFEEVKSIVLTVNVKEAGAVGNGKSNYIQAYALLENTFKRMLRFRMCLYHS